MSESVTVITSRASVAAKNTPKKSFICSDVPYLFFKLGILWHRPESKANLVFWKPSHHKLPRVAVHQLVLAVGAGLLAPRPPHYLYLCLCPDGRDDSQCTMWLSPLKSCIKEIKQNLILHSHFLEFTLFQTKYLEIILCPVSLFIYIWERVEHGQLKMEDIQWNQLQLKQAAGKIWIKFRDELNTIM